MNFIKYPVRCRIIDIAGEILDPMYPDIVTATPKVSQPHMGEEGLAEWVDNNVRITFSDGSVLWGYECWWTPIE